MNIKRTIITMFTIVTTILQAAGTLSPANSGLKPAEIVSHDVVVTINNGYAQPEVNQQFKSWKRSIPSPSRSPHRWRTARSRSASRP